MSRDFQDILKIFGVEEKREYFKRKNSFVIPVQEVSEFKQLILRYNTFDIWKKIIKKMDLCNPIFNIKAYQGLSNGEKAQFLVEIEFGASVLTSILRIMIQDEEEREKIEQEFLLLLNLRVQIPVLRSRQKLYNVIEKIDFMDLELSVYYKMAMPGLVESYYDIMNELTKELTPIINKYEQKWREISDNSRREYDAIKNNEKNEIYNSDKLNAVLQSLMNKISMIENEEGNKENSLKKKSESREIQQKRNQYYEKREQIKDVIINELNTLSPEERIVVLRPFLKNW